jgi:hypothetical protein
MDSIILCEISAEDYTGMLRNRNYPHDGAQSKSVAQLIIIVLVEDIDQQTDQLYYSFASIIKPLLHLAK